jgi:dipeptide/tripeptide permease
LLPFHGFFEVKWSTTYSLHGQFKMMLTFFSLPTFMGLVVVLFSTGKTPPPPPPPFTKPKRQVQQDEERVMHAYISMFICVIAHSIIHANHLLLFEIEDISNQSQICQIRETFEYKNLTTRLRMLIECCLCHASCIFFT